MKKVDDAIASRKRTAELYREGLKNVAGIRYLNDMEGVRHNYSYFPVFVDEKEYGISRDELYFKMQKENIFCRRYFYPLISTFSTYKGLDSAKTENLPIATRIADSVICLPVYAGLENGDIERIIKIIAKK
ncbi:MAG: DegT/DnrJ/EryC1/StrS family aminotransferase [Prevotellaceae bacterium]|nr:DegT/DnrJ/EryC1/StrS family aminotransferase [Prevotellaceae bacterium]